MKKFRKLYGIAEDVICIKKRIESIKEQFNKEQFTIKCFEFEKVEIIEHCTEKNGRLYKDNELMDNLGLVDDSYYLMMRQSDSTEHKGIAYFNVDSNGTFVAMPFRWHKE